jgi:NAD(P)-dependent dehydrogenase (short-subunit alcohol dehydrogenase family)
VALITGASRGIGRGVALEIAGIGHDLVINFASSTKDASATAADCVATAAKRGHKIKAVTFRADISKAGDRQGLIEFTREEFKRLDLLVNNAGIAPSVRADLLETTEESFDRLMAVNARAPFFLTQLAARWMVEQAKKQPPIRARIVTITSVSAYTASINRGEYCVSKAALSMLTPLFAARLAEHGIQVFEIRPGIVATDMTKGVKEKYDAMIANGLTPIARWGTPEDVGKAVAAIAQGLLPFSTGEVINVDGGFHMKVL